MLCPDTRQRAGKRFFLFNEISIDRYVSIVMMFWKSGPPWNGEAIQEAASPFRNRGRIT